MAQEIRLGSSESMKNINLGSTELQEVYLGAILIWRNNVPPFYTVDVNGVTVSTNGTIIAPVKPPQPSAAPIQNFEYTSTIAVGISNIQEEDQPAGNIVFNLYDGNFEVDPTLPVIATFTAVQGGSGTLTIPRGPQPTGGTATDFLYSGRLFSITATDTEAGVSIQFLKVTRIDSEDVKNFGGYTNSGGTYNPRTSTSTQSGLTTTFNTACYDATSTTLTFDRTSSTPVASQNQTRTCSVQIVGIQDTPPKVCSTSDQNRTITVATGGASTTDTTTNTVDFANPSYITGAAVNNSVGGGSTPGASIITFGTCGSCVEDQQRYNCRAEQPKFTQPTTQATNCNGSAFGSPTPTGSPTTSTAFCTAPNQNYVTPNFEFNRCSMSSGNTDLVFRGTASPSDYNQWCASFTITCTDGTTQVRGSCGTTYTSPLNFCNTSNPAVSVVAQVSINTFSGQYVSGPTIAVDQGTFTCL
jgi:hypothetical protein